MLACVRRGQARLLDDGEDALLVETPRHGRRIQFRFHEVRGLRETARRDRPAGRGSSRPGRGGRVEQHGTDRGPGRCTSDLGRSGREEGPGPAHPLGDLGPRRSARGRHGPVALLDLDPGRTFRFCPNNQRQADLVARCLADHDDGSTLERAYTIEDRHDPYSVDLADCFRRVIERIAPAQS